MKIKRFFFTFIAALASMTISFGATAAANNTVVVTPTNQQGFEGYTQSGATISFVVDPTAPGGVGALRLTTNGTVDSYAGYTKETNTPLANINQLSYYTKQNSGPAVADAAFALGVNLTGTGGSTFLIYEPYYQGPITPGVFEFQDVDQGLFYSTDTVQCEFGTIGGSPGEPATYTLNQIKQACPNAVVNLFGVFIGTYNLNYNVEVDLLNFNGTTYDFEPYLVATNKEQCKNGGWQFYRRANGTTFKNQGDCIQYVNTGK